MAYGLAESSLEVDQRLNSPLNCSVSCPAGILSVLIYAAETWTLALIADMKTLEAFHMKC